MAVRCDYRPGLLYHVDALLLIFYNVNIEAMRNKYLKIFTVLAFLVISNFTTPTLQAQCPMCKIAAESNLKNGGTAGKGLNVGILYMLATPYLIVGTIGYVWWRNRRKEKEELDEV